FRRKRPLVAKTLRRIAAGMVQFNGIDITPFLPMCAQAISSSTRILSGSDDHCMNRARAIEGVPFLIAAGGPEGKGRRPKSLQEPLPTVLTENHEALIQPF